MSTTDQSTVKKIIIPILTTGIWVNISETIRWICLIEPYWFEKYEQLGIIFPKEDINLIVWMIWGFVYATIIFILSRKFTLVQTTIYSWLVVFVMTWIVLWNIGILPTKMLWYNVPLSILETFVGALICKKLVKPKM